MSRNLLIVVAEASLEGAELLAVAIAPECSGSFRLNCSADGEPPLTHAFVAPHVDEAAFEIILGAFGEVAGFAVDLGEGLDVDLALRMLGFQRFIPPPGGSGE